jgi:hypothetical protein
MTIVVAIVALVLCGGVVPLYSQSATRVGMSGQQLYQSACAACHGSDGKGQTRAIRGFDLDPPDFTDCRLTTPEADLDWASVITKGGPVRGFDRMMPAFGDELSLEEIEKVIGYLRGFCTERHWPHGDLNMPRAFVTEKAYPENEAVLTVTGGDGGVMNEFLYERRVGSRGQYEVFVPVSNHGVGDIGAAYKHVLFDRSQSGSIVSAGGEIKLPTGSKSRGSGSGVTMLEAFGTISQTLPALTDGFLHGHAGIEAPADSSRAPKEAFWRLAVGRSYMKGTWGRAWSPMVELLGARELVDGATNEWDVLPQMQVSLSTRQHVLVSAGVRLPLNDRRSRPKSVLVYLLWDWFDGSVFSGW